MYALEQKKVLISAVKASALGNYTKKGAREIQHKQNRRSNLRN